MGFIIGIIFGVFVAGMIIHYRKRIVAYLNSFTG